MTTSGRVALFIYTFLGDKTQEYTERLKRVLYGWSKLYLVINDCDEETRLYIKLLGVVYSEEDPQSPYYPNYVIQLVKTINTLKSLKSRELGEYEYMEYQEYYSRFIHYLNRAIQVFGGEDRVLGLIDTAMNLRNQEISEEDLRVFTRALNPPVNTQVLLASRITACTGTYRDTLVNTVKALEAHEKTHIHILLPAEVANHYKEHLPEYTITPF